MDVPTLSGEVSPFPFFPKPLVLPCNPYLVLFFLPFFRYNFYLFKLPPTCFSLNSPPTPSLQAEALMLPGQTICKGNGSG